MGRDGVCNDSTLLAAFHSETSKEESSRREPAATSPKVRPNQRNGTSGKTIITDDGGMTIREIRSYLAPFARAAGANPFLGIARIH
jgi:hypothetical protein